MTKDILLNGWRSQVEVSPGPFDRVAPTLLDRLFQHVSCPLAQSAPKRAHVGVTGRRQIALEQGSEIALFAPDVPEFRGMKADIEELGGTATIVPEAVLTECGLRKHASGLSFCVVGHDFADADAAVDFCLELRRVAPALVIVLALAGIPNSDLSSERMSICEVTLRRPVSCVSLSRGIRAAFDNRATFESGRDQGASGGVAMDLPWEGLCPQKLHQSRQ
ncbi:hypothetical protein [Marivita sp.]|uniref:hypothetical protein n=1 Tax=Marivita sp. TaxID=2003365 RepID=UPI0025BB055E|nr:hypothetical protein [Marivita sp.]